MLNLFPLPSDDVHVDIDWGLTIILNTCRESRTILSEFHNLLSLVHDGNFLIFAQVDVDIIELRIYGLQSDLTVRVGLVCRVIPGRLKSTWALFLRRLIVSERVKRIGFM